MSESYLFYGSMILVGAIAIPVGFALTHGLVVGVGVGATVFYLNHNLLYAGLATSATGLVVTGGVGASLLLCACGVKRVIEKKLLGKLTEICPNVNWEVLSEGYAEMESMTTETEKKTRMQALTLMLLKDLFPGKISKIVQLCLKKDIDDDIRNAIILSLAQSPRLVRSDAESPEEEENTLTKIQENVNGLHDQAKNILGSDSSISILLKNINDILSTVAQIQEVKSNPLPNVTGSTKSKIFFGAVLGAAVPIAIVGGVGGVVGGVVGVVVGGVYTVCSSSLRQLSRVTNCLKLTQTNQKKPDYFSEEYSAILSKIDALNIDSINNEFIDELISNDLKTLTVKIKDRKVISTDDIKNALDSDQKLKTLKIEEKLENFIFDQESGLIDPTKTYFNDLKENPTKIIDFLMSPPPTNQISQLQKKFLQQNRDVIKKVLAIETIKILYLLAKIDEDQLGEICCNLNIEPRELNYILKRRLTIEPEKPDAATTSPRRTTEGEITGTLVAAGTGVGAEL